MAEQEKRVGDVSNDTPEVVPQYVDRPNGWMYKGVRIFGKEVWYAMPETQLVMVAFVCFLCPGMFNALGGIGAAGQQTATLQDNANVALYSTFAVVGFFAGSFANRLGIRLTCALGGIGYCIYSASFLCYNHTKNNGFVLFAGALLGVCAGLLWTAQGAIMMSYPPENKKGRYISWFWVIFNLGAVLGSLIPLGQYASTGKETSASDGTYAAFIVLMGLGAVVALFLCDADKVIRSDGSKVIFMKHPSWSTEFKGLWETFRSEPYIILLFPMFFSSNIFYTYQQNDLNAPHFSLRARSLNGVLYWLAQIIGAFVWGYALDFSKVSRSTRARVGLVALLVVTFAIWGGGYAWLAKHEVTRAEITAGTVPIIDWNDGSAFLGPMFLYFFYGMFDSFWQTTVYWYMGALSNSARKTANFAGFYKGIQSAGAAIFWRLDAIGIKIDALFGSTWGVLAFSIVCAAPVVFLRIKDHVDVEEDLKFSDETLQDVFVSKAAIEAHDDTHYTQNETA